MMKDNNGEIAVSQEVFENVPVLKIEWLISIWNEISSDKQFCLSELVLLIFGGIFGLTKKEKTDFTPGKAIPKW